MDVGNAMVMPLDGKGGYSQHFLFLFLSRMDITFSLLEDGHWLALTLCECYLPECCIEVASVDAVLQWVLLPMPRFPEGCGNVWAWLGFSLLVGNIGVMFGYSALVSSLYFRL